MRATIKEIHDNRVVHRFTDEWGEKHVFTYFAPSDGGYVRQDDGRQYPQVCERLYGMGRTLVWSPKRESLVALIRREWKRRRDYERRL